MGGRARAACLPLIPGEPQVQQQGGAAGPLVGWLPAYSSGWALLISSECWREANRQWRVSLQDSYG